MADLKASEIIKYPSMAEKSVAAIESQNKLVFIVDNRATKNEIKDAVEKQFAVKVEKVNVVTDRKNRKKAFVKLDKKFKAEQVATALGVV